MSDMSMVSDVSSILLIPVKEKSGKVVGYHDEINKQSVAIAEEDLQIPDSLAEVKNEVKTSKSTSYCINDLSEESNKCLCTPPSKQTAKEIKACVNRLLYDPDKTQTDKELLTIVILRKKVEKFKFMKGFTMLQAVGTWREVDADGRVIKEYPDEKNVQIDVEFKDRPDEAIHRGLLGLLKEYNKKEVGEQLLYMRVRALEDSSL